MCVVPRATKLMVAASAAASGGEYPHASASHLPRTWAGTSSTNPPPHAGHSPVLLGTLNCCWQL